MLSETAEAEVSPCFSNGCKFKMKSEGSRFQVADKKQKNQTSVSISGSNTDSLLHPITTCSFDSLSSGHTCWWALPVWKASWVGLHHKKKAFLLSLAVENHKEVKQPGSRSHSWSVAQPAAQSGFPDPSHSLWCHATFLCPWNPSANFPPEEEIN